MPPIPDVLSEDTIAAIATSPGRGAVAIVRISGPRALAVALSLFPTLAASSFEPRRARLLRITNPENGDTLDHALVTFFPGPESFTGEDTVEMSTHGGMLVPQMVLAATVAAGARVALPGEFTRRALAGGKLDLIQAEAILDLVNGSSPALHRAAIDQLERGLSQRIETLRRGIIRAEALLSYGIDFPDEDEPPVPPQQIAEAVADARAQIERMLARAPQAAMLREGALVVLAGRPNAGKSSLFNALLGYARSIVTELPGTTRDAVEATVAIGGYPFRLVDTAGLREAGDRIEGMGVEVARRYLAGADLLLYCVDGTEELDEADSNFLAERPASATIILRTKSDLVGGVAGDAAGGAGIRVSAMTGEGLDGLAAWVVASAFGMISDGGGDEPLLTRQRHVNALGRASAELDAFDAAFENMPAEIAATHLRNATGALEDVVGIVATDDVLGAIFSEFCVGK